MSGIKGKSGIYKRTSEHREKISMGLKDGYRLGRRKSWNKGKTGHTLGEENGMWKGDKVGYMGIHAWVKRHKTRTNVCHNCSKEGKTDFSNISGEYKRDLIDWVELCRSCHFRADVDSGKWGKATEKYLYKYQ